MRIWFLLPAYNEATNLAPLIYSLLQHLNTLNRATQSNILIVDDGSSDHTPQVAVSLMHSIPNVHYIRNPSNLGLGGAIKEGIRFLVRKEHLQPEDIVFTMDADRTQHPHSVGLMIDKHNEGYDLVIASRYVKDSIVTGVPPLRQLSSSFARIICHLLWPHLPIKDFTTNYRMYAGHILLKAYDYWKDDLITFTRSFVAPLELLVKTAQFANQITEVPVILHYEIRGDASKMPTWKTINDLLKLIALKLFSNKIP